MPRVSTRGPLLNSRGTEVSLRHYGGLFFLFFLAILSGCDQAEPLPADNHGALQAGWNLISLDEFDRAESVFQALAARCQPGTRDFYMARYGLGNAYQHRKPGAKLDEAKAVYAEVAAQDKGGEMGGWSALAFARIDHLRLFEVGKPIPDDAALTAVQQEYRRVTSDFSTTMAAEEAALYDYSVDIEKLNEASLHTAVTRINAWIAAHPKSLYSSDAYGRLASAYEMLKESRGRMDALIKCCETALEPAADAMVYYEIAAIADLQLGDVQTARTYYRRVLIEYPYDKRAFWCTRALQRLEAGGEALR